MVNFKEICVNVETFCASVFLTKALMEISLHTLQPRFLIMFIKSRPNFLQLSKHITEKKYTSCKLKSPLRRRAFDRGSSILTNNKLILKTALAGKVIYLVVEGIKVNHKILQIGLKEHIS